jgi:hypothetical protein
LSAITVSGTNITDGTINTIDLANNAVTPAKLLPGAANTVLSTNGTGTIVWSTPTISPDAQDLALVGNVLSLTNDGTPVDLSAITVSGTNITDGTINTVDLANNAVTPAKLLPGATNTILSTNGAGTIVWSAPTPEAQDLTLAGNILSLTNDGTPVDLSAVTTGGQITGSLNALSINANSITSAQLQNSVVTTAKMATAGLTDANKIYTTDATGLPQLELKSAMIAGTTASGDLSGTYPAPVVAKIQSNPVSAGVLGAGDAGKILIWNGTQWVPQVVNGVSPISRYVMIDPADFTNLRRDDKKDKDNIIVFEDNSTYVTTIKKDEGPTIIAPVHLPDGATLEQVTLFYMDREARNIDFNFYRKTPTGANENVTNSWSSTGSSAAIQSSLHTPIVGRTIVDNDAYSYRIVIRLDQTNDTNDSGDADLRVYAVKIKYLP